MRIVRDNIVYILLCVFIGTYILGMILCKNKDNKFITVDKNYSASLNIIVSDSMKSYIEEYASEFNKIYPNIDIKIICENGANKDIAAMAKNKTSTLLVVKTKSVQGILKNDKDKIEDITEFMANYKDNFLKSHIDNLSVEGKIYGVPLSEKPYFMIYKKDIFDKAKINIDDIKTWNDYINVCNMLNKNLKSNYKFMHHYKNANLYEMFLNQLGKGYDNVNLIAKSDESNKSLQLIRELYKNKFVYLTEDYEKIIEEITKGKLISTICSSEDLVDIAKNNTNFNEKFTIKKMPSFELGGNRDLNHNKVSILVVNNRLSKVGNTFINFIVNNERIAVELYLKQGVVTANTNIYKSKILENKNKWFNNENIYSLINNIVVKAPSVTYDSNYKNIYRLINKNIKNVNDDKFNFADFYTNVIKQFP